MIRWLLDRLMPAPKVPCWCGKAHRATYWHDPTGGTIDRDIQEQARDLLDIPFNASLAAIRAAGRGDDIGRLVAIEQTMQHRRNQTQTTRSHL